MSDENRAVKELYEVFEDLDTLLKHPDVGTELASRGVNQSLAIVAAEALLAYVQGDKARAAEDFDTVAEEIGARLRASKEGKDGAGEPAAPEKD
jgi:hypothetical protein